MADGREERRGTASPATTWLVARGLGGALLRIGRATSDYLRAAPRSSSAPLTGASSEEEDTGEWPAPGARA